MVGINHVPFRPNFYILSARFVFSDKFKISTKYRMSNSKIRRKRFGLYPIVFVFSVFYRHIPFYVFTTMCMAVAMNLLNLLSEYGLYYVCGCELVCEVVNYYHGLQLLMLLSFIYCFHVLISDLLDDWVSYGSVCFRFNFPYTVFFNIYPFELVRFRFPVSSFSFSCSTIPFSISFSY